LITTATRLTKSERASLARLLERELGRSIRAAGHVQLSGDRAADPLDEASLLTLQEADAALCSRSADGLLAIQDAQRRLRDTPEQFGICQSCRNGIPFARLEMVPTATCCIDCT
jgi:RNA polymerase-binding transcription factor DksA